MVCSILLVTMVKSLVTKCHSVTESYSTSRHGLNKEPLDEQTILDHLNQTSWLFRSPLYTACNTLTIQFQVKRMREKVTGRGLTTGYLEGADSDDEDISIAAIKNKYKKNKQGNNILSRQEQIQEE